MQHVHVYVTSFIRVLCVFYKYSRISEDNLEENKNPTKQIQVCNREKFCLTG